MSAAICPGVEGQSPPVDFAAFTAIRELPFFDNFVEKQSAAKNLFMVSR
jgi:hypothetical protein